MSHHRIRISLIIITVLIACLAGGSTATGEAGEPRGVAAVRIHYLDGTTRDAILVAQSCFANAKPKSEMTFLTPTGQVWITTDNLVSISEINQGQPVDKTHAVFRFRRGQPRVLSFGGFTEKLLVQNDDDSREVIDLTKVAGLQVMRGSVSVKKSPTSQPTTQATANAGG